MTTESRRLEYVPLDDLLPADRNPKEHDEQLIADSIGRFGFVETPVLDERTGKLIAGHGRSDRLRILRDEGADPPEGVEVRDGVWYVPTLRGWASKDDDEAHAAGIALNRIGERGGWDYTELYEMLDRFSLTEDGLTGLGFDADDLDDIVAKMQEQTIRFGEDVSFGGGGAHAEPDFDDRAEKYAVRGARSIILDYGIEDFDELTAKLAQLRDEWQIASNAELVARLIRDAVTPAA